MGLSKNELRNRLHDLACSMPCSEQRIAAALWELCYVSSAVDVRDVCRALNIPAQTRRDLMCGLDSLACDLAEEE
jgi:hypothetical protein